MMKVLGSLRFPLILAFLLVLAAAQDDGDEGAPSANSLYLFRGDPMADGVVQDYHKSKSGRPLEGRYDRSRVRRVVNFYSPYCGHCQKFKPRYIELASEMIDVYGKNVEFYAVSCTAHQEVCQDHHIHNYPQLVVMGIDDDSKVKFIEQSDFNREKLEDLLEMGKLGMGDEAVKGREVEEVTKRSVDDASNSGAKDESKGNADNRDGDEVEKESPGKTRSRDEKESPDGSREDKNSANSEENRGGDEVEQNDSKGDEVHRNSNNDSDESPGIEHSGPGQSNERARGGRLQQFDRDSSNEEQNERERYNVVAAAKPRPGAETARMGMKDYERYGMYLKEKVVQQQQQMMMMSRINGGKDMRPIVPERGASITMRENRVGSAEYLEKQRRVNERLQELKKKRGIRPNRRDEWKGPNVSARGLPYQAVVTKKRVAERIPGVKRVIKIPLEEMLILDATLSFIQGLRMGVFKQSASLNIKQKDALKDWLDLASISLPQEWAVHETVDDLRGNLDAISRSADELENVLKRHKLPRKTWSPSCAKGSHPGSNPFSCGFWKLLHVMSMGIAEHRGGLNLISSPVQRNKIRVFSPLEAANTLREYMLHFFVCQPCSTHFVAQYDQCDMNRRCDRLAEDAEYATDADWKEMAKWLWEFHNDVNVRLVNENADDKLKKKQKRVFRKAAAGPGFALMDDQADAFYPSVWICSRCYTSDGVFDEDAVFSFLERTYWPGIDEATDRMLKFVDEETGTKMLTVVLIFVGIYLAVSMKRSLGQYGLQGTMIKARNMRPKGAVGVAKRSA